MDLRSIFRSQYHAALDMLEATIAACPDAVWDRPDDANPSWQVAYHALFYTHLYLQPTEADFTPWERHRPHLQVFGDHLPWPPFEPVERGAPLTRAEVLDYVAVCRAEVDRRVAALDFDAPSGFGWLPMGKLEVQLYNLRHVMQHTGELYERLGRAGIGTLPWVGRGRAAGGDGAS